MKKRTGKRSHRNSSKSSTQKSGGGRPRSAAGTGTGNGAPQRRSGFPVSELLARLDHDRLAELFEFWAADGEVPETEDELRRRLRACMNDPAIVDDRFGQLGRRLGAVVEHLVNSPMYQESWDELSGARSLSYMSAYEIEACLAALARRGFVVEGDDLRFERYGQRTLGLPTEIGDGLVRRRRERMSGIFGVLTLRGHLDQVYSDPENSRMTPQRLRELYKTYSQESASIARIERLPEGVRGLVEKAILEFGGLLPRALFERMETRLPHWNGRRWQLILEQSLIGTVRELDLSRYGIQLKDEALVVFNEVALAWLRRVAVPGDPDRPHEELSLGIDLATNVSRFLAYIDENGVRFTVRGEIFKTTEKRILQHLIPNPGRELPPEDVLRFVFEFCRASGLIDRTGKRTFCVAPRGREWSSRSLLEKQQAVLEFALEERPDNGILFHQPRMRRILLSMLKRIEPGVWYDLMYLPFLARNTYLSSLDDLHVDDDFSERANNGRFVGMPDAQRLAWNLVQWVRRRLYLLGVVDLGYDKARRPVALRLTQSGARLLGMDRIGPMLPSGLGSIVVTPDFEVVLFPTGDDDQLVHDLDRFCTREKEGSLLHFRIHQEGVIRALKDGMTLDKIQGVLAQHSRTPVPQNVEFSIRDWALRAGLMRLDEGLVLVCEEPEVLRRFQQDAGARRHMAEVVDERTVRLKGRVTLRRMQSLLRELGYLVEIGRPLV